MDSGSTSSAIALSVSLICFAIVVIAEASIASITRERLRSLVSDGTPGAAILENLHQLPTGASGALSLSKIVTFSAALISALALVIAQFNQNWTIIALVSLAVVFSLGMTNVAAQRLASTCGILIALKLAFPVRALAWLLNPILATQARLATVMFDSNGGRADSSGENTSEDLNHRIAPDGEPLDEHEVRMIRGVVQLDKTMAREIMVPRVDMTAAEIETPIDELAAQMMAEGHSKIPIYRGDLDRIEGIAYAMDVLRYLAQNEKSSEMTIESIIRPALFIPESKSLEELLKEFQQKRFQLAVVIDEYGGVSGLVTVEDLLEEIVGEIQDEFDIEEPEIRLVNDGEFLMDASIGIDQLNELLSVSVEGEGFDTVGGFVYHQLGRIPSPGDAIEYDGLKIEVVSTVGRRLKHLKVIRFPAGTRSQSK